MSFLVIVLTVKILVTVFALVLPFLLFSQSRIDRLSGFGGTPLLLYRLYGIALLALAVAYGGGLWQTLNGQFPWIVAIMGLVSNGGASGLLIISGAARSRIVSTVVFGGIALGLAASLAFPAWSTQAF